MTAKMSIHYLKTPTSLVYRLRDTYTSSQSIFSHSKHSCHALTKGHNKLEGKGECVGATRLLLYMLRIDNIVYRVAGKTCKTVENVKFVDISTSI